MFGRAKLFDTSTRRRGATRTFVTALLAATAVVLGTLAPAAPAFAAGTLTLNVTITDPNGAPVTTVNAQTMQYYSVNIAYSCSTEACQGVTVQVAAPPVDPFYGTYRKEIGEASYVPPFNGGPTPTGTLATGYTVNLGTLAAGTGGSIRFDYDIATRIGGTNGGSYFVNGSTIQPQVTLSAANAATVSQSPTATWVSTTPTPPAWVVNGSGNSILTGEELTMTAFAETGCASFIGTGYYGIPYALCAQSYEAVVQLPARAVYVPGSGGVYDPGTHTVRFAASGTSAARGLVDNTRTFKVTFPSSAYPTTGAGCEAVETFTGLSHTVTYLDGSTKSSSNTPTFKVTVGNCAPFSDASATKDVGAADGTTGGSRVVWIPATGTKSSFWAVQGINEANVPASVRIVDTQLDSAIYPVTVIGGSGSGFPATLNYTLNTGVSGTTTLASAGAEFSAPAGTRFASVEAISSTLPASSNTSPAGNIRNVQFTIYGRVVLGPEATPGTKTNSATVTVSFPNNPDLQPITLNPSASVIVQPAPSSIGFTAEAPVAAPPSGTPLVGTLVPWTMKGTISNKPAGSTIVPQYVFLAPEGWDVVAGSATFPNATPGASFTYPTVTYGGKQYKAVIATWQGPTGVIGTENLPELKVTTVPTSAAIAGNNNQTGYFFLGDAANSIVQSYVQTKVTDTTDIDGDGSTEDAFALRTGVSSLAARPNVAVIKEICQPDTSQSDGCNWVADSNILVGVPPTATSIKYRVTVRNTGNSALNSIVAYDVLPYPGDTGTTTATANTPRGSTVQEALASVTNPNADVTLAYSTSTNPSRPEVYDGGTGTWTTTVAGAAAIRVQIPTLPPQEERTFLYTASLVGGSADKVACNSVAVTATGLVPSEREAVCATTQEADFRVEPGSRFPLQEGRTGVLPFVVTNGGGSLHASGEVSLVLPAGVTIVDLVIPNWSCSTDAMSGPATVTCLPVTADGSSRSLERAVPETINLKVVPATGTAGGQICADASVDGLMFDPDLSNNDRTVCSTVLSGSALLSITKTDARDSARVGDQLTYTVTAANALVAESAVGAVITDTLPSGVRFVAAGDGGTVTGQSADGTGGVVTWPAVTLAPAGTASSTGDNGSGAAGSTVTRTVTVEVVAAASGDIRNVAEVNAPDPAVAGAQLSAQGEDVDELRRLTVTKSSDAPAAGVRTGDIVTYTVTMENTGTSDYTAGSPATLTDDLTGVRDDATFVTGSATASVDGGATQPLPDPAAGVLTWSGPLAAGSTVVIEYRVEVGSGTGGDAVLTNTAVAAAQAAPCVDGVTAAFDSCDTVSTRFAPTLAKTIASSTQNDDGTWTTVYELTVSNLSPDTSATYSLSDALAYGTGIDVLSAAVTSAPSGVTPAAWSGSGTLVSGVTIAAGAQHVYRITVTADAQATTGTPAATCVPGVQSGFANRATLALTDGRTELAEACAAPVAPTVQKTVAAPVQLPDGRWSVVYTVTVRNPHRAPADLAYTLRDVLDIPAGITVDDVTVVGPAGAPVNGAFDGVNDTVLLSGVDRIPAASATSAATRVYTITLTTDAESGAGTPSQLACPPAGTGGYLNTVTLFAGTGSTALAEDSACADATPQPMPEIAKSVVSSSIDSEGVWTLVYRIDVTNPDATYSTRYSLDDELAFAAGATIVSAAAASGDVAVSATWTGQGDDRLVTDEPLPAGTTHTFSVTVQVDPDSIDPESALADCRIDAGEASTGFRNLATVTSGAQSAFAEACQPFTDPSVVKSVVGAPTQDPDTGVWAIEYQLTVTNRSTTTTGTIPYTLTDELGFAAELGGEVVDVEAPAGATLAAGFDGIGQTEVGSFEIGAAPDETTPAVQVWTITVEFDVPAGLSDGVTCDPDQGAGGLQNVVEIAVGDRVSGAVACADVPEVPLAGVSKSVLSQEQQADGTWAVEYEVTVANPSATAASRYTLDDQFAFGLGMTLVGDPTVEAPAGVDVESDFDGDAATTISEDILLPAAGSHTYTVRAVVDAGSVTGDDPAGDCVWEPGETGTGFGNIAWVGSDVATTETSACARAWDPGVTKELNGVPVQQSDGSWLLSYTMSVSNPSAVPLSYGLVDELAFPTGTVVTVVSAASRPGGPAVNPDWDGESDIQLVADGTPLPANAIHVFDVTVKAVLPEDQESTENGWANTATVESGVDGVVATDAAAEADILLPELVITKTATPSAEFLRIGDTVEYEITVENEGLGDFTELYPAVVWDDQRDLADDADVSSPDDGGSPGIFATFQLEWRWASALLSGESVTITYTATITGGGNADLVNVAYAAEPEDGAPPAPDLDDCIGNLCAFTETPLAALEVTKTVDQTTVAPGSTVRYTVTVTNTGHVDIPEADPAVVTDDLIDVLDDADDNGDATADIGTVEVTGATLTWTGGLAVGETATISYSVTVRGGAPNGAKLVNAVVSDPTLPTLALDGTASDGTASTTTTVQRIATTGADGGWLGIRIAALLLVLGAALAFIQQRRRRTALGS